MRAEHDGYTLLASETGFYTTQPYLYAKGKLAYDAEMRSTKDAINSSSDRSPT